MSIAFVLGNGRSRLAVDLYSLRIHGKIYGCNKLYTEFVPDVLVATDPPISNAIMDSGYALQNAFFTRIPKEGSGAKLITEHYGFSSGPIALNMAVNDGHGLIFMVGFDMDGINGKFNNVYAGTQFYKPEGSEETHWSNWEQQVAEISRKCKGRIIRVNDKHVVPKTWTKIKHVSMAEFLQAINKSKLEEL